MDSYSEDFDVRISVIQDLIPLGLNAVADELQSEVLHLSGKNHSRAGINARWGWQNGSAYLLDQLFPIRVPASRTSKLTRKWFSSLTKKYSGLLMMVVERCVDCCMD